MEGVDPNIPTSDLIHSSRKHRKSDMETMPYAGNGSIIISKIRLRQYNWYSVWDSYQCAIPEEE